MKISKEIRLAILGIITITLFVLGFSFLKGTGMFSTSNDFLVEYSNVQGLTPACFVQTQGLNIGTVKSIELSKKNAGKILVTLSIQKDFQIPIDSKIKIVSPDLLSSKVISIERGTSSTMLKPNEMIQGILEADLMTDLKAKVTPVIDSAKFAIAELTNTIQSINSVLDVTSQQHLKNTLANADKTVANFTQFSNELNAQKTKISSLLNDLNTFSTNLNKNNTVINNVIKNAETTTANLSKVNIEGTVNELKSTLANLKSTLDKVNNGNGSLALLMNDDKLYKNLKNTLETTNNLIYDLSAHPSKYVNINIIGRKPKNDCPPQTAPNSNN